MKSYCHNSTTCRRVALMSAFEIPGELKKPSANAAMCVHIHANAQNVLMHYFVYIRSA